MTPTGKTWERGSKGSGSGSPPQRWLSRREYTVQPLPRGESLCARLASDAQKGLARMLSFLVIAHERGIHRRRPPERPGGEARFGLAMQKARRRMGGGYSPIYPRRPWPFCLQSTLKCNAACATGTDDTSQAFFPHRARTDAAALSRFFTYVVL